MKHAEHGSPSSVPRRAVTASQRRRVNRPNLKPLEPRTDPRGCSPSHDVWIPLTTSPQAVHWEEMPRRGAGQTGISHAQQPAPSSLCSIFQLPSLLFQPWLYYQVQQWDSLSGKFQGVGGFFFFKPLLVHRESSSVPITLQVPHPFAE